MEFCFETFSSLFVFIENNFLQIDCYLKFTIGGFNLKYSNLENGNLETGS